MLRKGLAGPHSSVGTVKDLRIGGRWFDPWLGQYSFRGLMSHCDRIHSSLTAVHCCDNGYVGKQPVAWKEYCADYWLKELQENMDKCTGRRDISEILLKTALNSKISSICLLFTLEPSILGSKKKVCILFSANFHFPLCLMSTYLVPKSRSEHSHYNRDFKL